MTFFLAVVVWDTQRISNYRKDCFGACMCAEDSVMCCRGKMMS